MSFFETIERIINTDQFGYIIHALELLVAEIIVGLTLEKRSKFGLRIALSSVIYLALSVILGMAFGGSIPYLRYSIAFYLSLAILPACFKGKIWDMIYCYIIAMATQNISFSISAIVVGLFGYNSTSLPLPFAIMFSVVYVSAQAFCLIVCRKKIQTQENGFEIDKIPLVLFSVVFVAINYVVQYDRQSVQSADFFLWEIMFIIFDLLVLYILLNMYENAQLKREKAVLDNLSKNTARQYELDKRAIELVNIKCHDLKKQIRELRSLDGEDKDRALRDVEKAVMIYDSIAKTGCNALDVILTNKCLECEKSGIRITYMVDGEALLFMKSTDVFSLFGNALDNAISEVGKVEDEQKRIINLSGVRRGDFVFIHIENYCDTALTFKNGLPETTNEDKNTHGFGMLSMKRIAESYGGVMTVECKEKLFSVDFTIPINA